MLTIQYYANDSDQRLGLPTKAVIVSENLTLEECHEIVKEWPYKIRSWEFSPKKI